MQQAQWGALDRVCQGRIYPFSSSVQVTQQGSTGEEPRTSTDSPGLGAPKAGVLTTLLSLAFAPLSLQGLPWG